MKINLNQAYRSKAPNQERLLIILTLEVLDYYQGYALDTSNINNRLGSFKVIRIKKLGIGDCLIKIKE